GLLHRQRADGPRAHLGVTACIQRPPFPSGAEAPVGLCGISQPFGWLSHSPRQITHVLRTRAPLYSPLRAFSLDLHVLGTPPAFVLSQDQTLQLFLAGDMMRTRRRRVIVSPFKLERQLAS